MFHPNPVQQMLPDECVRCSIASLFGLSRENVPHFYADNQGRWHIGLEKWLADRGLKYELWHATLTPPDEWYLGYGDSGPSTAHMVVMHKNQIWHDPLGCGITKFEAWLTIQKATDCGKDQPAKWKAWDAGEKAHARGVTLQDNPYLSFDKYLAEQWNLGWLSANAPPAMSDSGY